MRASEIEAKTLEIAAIVERGLRYEDEKVELKKK